MLNLESLQGKMLFIDSLKVETVNSQLILSLSISGKSGKGRITFHNVSSLHLKDIRYPMQISVEVRDNLSKGWQPDVRYSVHDFEDDTIRFFCEEIAIAE